ncbi:MAG: hypothetical protein GXO54_07715 [Chloroflexi bacterium]|nr:hypothetical protein [Chloroflexota bacterium]
MRKQLAALEEFHRAMGVFYAQKPTADIPEDVRELRIRLLQEELEEYIRAARAGSLVDIADALTDLLYVLLGTFITHGLQDVAEALFDEVHRSNMTKLGPDGRPIYREDGKVLKPPTYRPPDLARILAHGTQTEPSQEELL